METQNSSPSNQPNTKQSPPELVEPNKTNLYESVIAKYFEIIKSILPRISSLYLQNEEFQKNIFSLESKMIKIQKDHQNLHYEMRANHISIDTKINSLITDYTNISNENARIKKQNDELSKEIKEVKSMQSTQKIITGKQNREGQITEEMNFKKQKGKKITFAQKKSNKVDQNEKENYKLKLVKKSSINLYQQEQSNSDQSNQSNDQIESSLSKIEVCFSSKKQIVETQRQFNLSSGKSLQNFTKSEKIFNRKTNLKTESKVLKGSQKVVGTFKSQKVMSVFQQKSSSSIEKYKEILKEIQSFHHKNQNIKKNYEVLINEYSLINQEGFAKIHSQIKQIKAKISELDYFHVHVEKIKLTLQNKMGILTKDIDLKLDTKVNKTDFVENVDDFNRRLAVIHQERKKLAIREQTKKACQFLQNKINNILLEINENIKQPTLHLVDLQMNNMIQTKSVILKQKDSHGNYVENGDRANQIRSKRRFIEKYGDTKRQVQSLHSNFHNETRFNQQKNQNRPDSQKNQQKLNSFRTKRKYSKDNIAFLRERSLDLLQKKVKNNRIKIKKEKVIFQYD